MNNLQLASALAAPTGTGLLYVAYGQGIDESIWKVGSGATRSTVSLKRVQAKPTTVFPGVERFEFKRTTYHTVGDVEYTAISSIVTSVPVPVVLADRTAIHLNLALLSRDDILKNAIETGAIPT